MLHYIRYFVCLTICIFILTACNSSDQLKVEKIDSFTFIDQNNQLFGTDELLGKIWMASFVFTNCETVCPPMMFEMASLQKVLAEQAIEIEFVSFTVDPEIDTADVLKNYLKQFTDDEENWHMLTGYSQEEIEEFGLTQFQTIIQKPETSHQVIHGTNFYLVDDQGYLINEYNYIDDSYVEEIIKDINNLDN